MTTQSTRTLLTRAKPVALALMAAVALASPGRARAAGLLLADGGLGGELAIREHAVNVTVNNGVAVTQVRQVFENLENRQVEALYTFPVPKNASVSNFSMWINGKEMTGEVVEKKRARDIYNSYKQVRRDPGLLEQTDYRTFEMCVFPIAPRAKQKIEVTYYQELAVDHDWATYVYPLASSTRKDLRAVTTGTFSLNLNAKSEVPIVAMESPSHAKDFAIAKHTEGYYQASLETKDGNLNRDVVLNYHLVRPQSGVDLITSKQPGEDGYFCLTVTAGEELATQNKGMDYVFVLDTSGSMNDDGKLDVSRQSLHAFTRALGKEDRFEVITFNVQATPLFSKLVAAEPTNLNQADDFLQTQAARGGTVLKPAMSMAYRYDDKERPLNVVILSDGLTEQQEQTPLIQMIKSRPANSRVFCIGVGNDVNKNLLEQMAQDSGGLAAFLSREENFERAAQGFRRKLLRPVATDLQLDFGNLKVYDLEPKTLPNLYHGMPVRVYGRYADSGTPKVTLRGKINDTPLQSAAELTFPANDAGNPEIERMWAWHKVQRLQKEGDALGSRQPMVDEIVRLGEGYSIVTEYTSFLVLENDSEYQRWKIDRRNVTRIARDRSSQQILQARLEKLREHAANEQLAMVDSGKTPLATPPQLPPAGPQASAPVAPGRDPAQNSQAITPPAPADLPQQPARRGWDLAPRSGGGGGGALDAGSVILMAGLAIVMVAAERTARRTAKEQA